MTDISEENMKEAERLASSGFLMAKESLLKEKDRQSEFVHEIFFALQSKADEIFALKARIAELKGRL